MADPVTRPELADTVRYVDLDTLLATADIVTVHTPLDDITTHMLDAAAFKKMKKTAYLINAARGPIVDTAALIEALQRGEMPALLWTQLKVKPVFLGLIPAESGVDNTNLETLKALPNVEISPHIGFYTDAAVKNMIDISLDDVKTILAGGHSPHQVN